MHYRRAFTPGGTFFFTLVTEGRRPVFASAEAVDILRTAFRKVGQSRPFEIEAAVVMPDHLHCIWTLPPGDADFSTRWRRIKTWVTKHCSPALRAEPKPALASRREQAVWQHRYWEHLPRDEADFSRHVDYIHYNPVKHGLAASPMDWPYSSFHRHVEAGIYPPDWGRGTLDFKGIGHEKESQVGRVSAS
jgi:putative transposase